MCIRDSMNVMLATVTERTREIGIRKALGAKRRHILRQFVIESMLISVLGGAVGVGIGIGLSAAAQNAGVSIRFASPFVVFGALLFCSFVGAFFGVYPAYKASRLDPIEALRHE